jgi:membrane protease YdiL (CAAX protease family)
VKLRDITYAGVTKTLGTYRAQSRNGINSLVLVAPLFVVYQLGILLTHGWKSGVDFVTPRLLLLFGGNKLYYSLFNVAVLAVFVAVFFILRKKRTLHPLTAGGVAVESLLYAAVMGGVAARILFALGLSPEMLVPAAADGPPSGIVNAVVLSIGAGTYEELFFRLVMLGGLLLVLEKTKLKRWQSVVIAVVSSSLVFSACHYVPLGIEPWGLWSFSFRFLLGVFFAVLYVVRGFAVAVYTHSFYDIFILVPRALVV